MSGGIYRGRRAPSLRRLVGRDSRRSSAQKDHQVQPGHPIVHRFVDSWQQTRSWKALYVLAGLGAMIALSAIIVYASGGTRTAALHIVYIPIFLAALWFGVNGGILAAVVAGVALGPMMPLSTATGEMQSAINWLSRLSFLVLFGAIAGLVLSVLREHSARLRDAAFISSDTGLPTRQRLTADLRQWVADGGQVGTIVVVGATNFDAIASWLGFTTARHLPAAMHSRIGAIIGGGVHFYELGPNRLAIAAPPAEPAGLPLGRVIGEQLKSPLRLGRTMVYVEAATGEYAPSSEDVDAEEIVRRACSAMLDASKRGATSSRYTPRLDELTRQNLEMIESLSTGLEASRVYLEYQPKIDLASGRVLGAEALVRLRERDGRVIPPGRFMPFAEQSNVIHELTAFVVDAAVRQLVRWRERGFDLTMAINFSVRNLQSDEALDQLAALISENGLPPSAIEIEVTESARISDHSAFRAVLERARSIGVQVAIDDFGAGYTSLAHLGALPLNTLKVDRSLVSNIADVPNSRLIFESIVTLCRELELAVVAEGIEDQRVYDHLRKLGCPCGQGFHIARPMAAAEFDRWLYENDGRFRADGPVPTV